MFFSITSRQQLQRIVESTGPAKTTWCVKACHFALPIHHPLGGWPHYQEHPRTSYLLNTSISEFTAYLKNDAWTICYHFDVLIISFTLSDNRSCGALLFHFLRYYPECTIINFGNWFVLCLPICIIMLILSWLFLHWMYIGSKWVIVMSCFQ